MHLRGDGVEDALFEARIKQVPATSACYIVMHGPYDQMPKGFSRLYSWAGALGLKPTGMPIAVFLTDPSKTPEFEAEWELLAPVEGDPIETGPNEKGLGVKHVGEMTVASTIHKGPYDAMRPAYTALMRWISDRSYVPDGPPGEVYMSDPNDAPPSEYLTEIRVPVRKVARPG